MVFRYTERVDLKCKKPEYYIPSDISYSVEPWKFHFLLFCVDYIGFCKSPPIITARALFVVPLLEMKETTGNHLKIYIIQSITKRDNNTIIIYNPLQETKAVGFLEAFFLSFEIDAEVYNHLCSWICRPPFTARKVLP